MSSTRRRFVLRASLAAASLPLLFGGRSVAGVLDVSWTAPTINTDGSPLTDLAGYRIYYDTGSSPCPGGAVVAVASPSSAPSAGQSLATTLTDLTVGVRYYVSATAVDANGNESPCVTPVASAVARIDVALTPAGTVNFGTVAVGSSADQVFTVQNTGGGTVSGAASSASPSFTIVSGSPFTVAGAGASQAVTVRFQPTAAVTATSNITFTTTDGVTLSPTVTGTGRAVTDADTVPPTVTVTTPASTTKVPAVTLTGTASDNVGVTQVTWANSRGGSGTATGTTSWSADNILLQRGPNVITVTARDAAGNSASATLTIKRSN